MNAKSKKLLPTHKLTFIRSISKMRLNSFGADIYKGDRNQVYIICDKLSEQIPYANIEFASLDACEDWLDKIPGNAAGRLDTVLNRLIPGREEHYE